MGFRTFHPQGMVKIGDALYVSSVGSSSDRAISGTCQWLRSRCGRGRRAHLPDRHDGPASGRPRWRPAPYHPGGIDYDGTNIWVPLTESPDSHSIIYRVDPATMKATEVLRYKDHLGGIVHNTDDDTLHMVSWGSRRF
jgi:hypothetical protein